MMKTVSTITAAVVLLAFSNVLAQSEAPAPAAPPPPPASTPAPAPAPVPTMEGGKKGEQHEVGDEQEGKGRGKGKHKGKDRDKGGEKMRGLDRADEIAGAHGKQGRDNARSRGKRGRD